jgi:glucokinase
MILAGDIGGTNTRLGLFESDDKRPRALRIETFASSTADSLVEILRQFVGSDEGKVSAACFGLPGPVIAGAVKTPNLPWIVILSELRQCLGIDQVELINDLEANAHGISTLGPDDLVVLNEGSPSASGNAGLISAGTGLGEAGLHWDGDFWQPFASEGGHVDFAPRNDLEAAMLSWMLRQHEHVSYERFLSGPGLHNIYRFLIEYGCGQEPDWLRDAIAAGNPGAEISKAAMEKGVEICQTALDRFVSIYGAESGNIALKMLATGGVFIGGGIAPKILAELRKPPFMEAFLTKGRMRPLLEGIPVKVIVNDLTALNGAARVALFGVRMRRDHPV